MSRILLITFFLCSMLGINQPSKAGEFESNTYIELTEHFMTNNQANQSAGADTMNFPGSVTLLSNSESYDHYEHSSWLAIPKAQIGINSQWQLSTQFSIYSFIKYQQHITYPLEYTSNHAATEMLQENTASHNEYTVLGSEVILQQLFNNKLILGVNYQMNLPLFAQLNSSNQQFRTYANYQLIENLNLHLDWMISASASSSSQNLITQGKLFKPKNANEIYSQFILFSVSYKM
ncbi:hypothetical protein [Shewanella holmiensis]|uniref:DUF481 domain-containing protein n=1 Tax=Shewanella holmiensis TaxID=2952222 RepID=A0A9X2WR58_9GAMM|nr:hypothetical protein [Shewanella holmiensis]MCT7943572.1 hypothetical protein [Shewanella holmiensis]